MLAIFLAPFSGGVKVNKAEAEVTPDPNNSNLQLQNNGEKLILTSPTRGIGYASAIFDIKAINLKTEKTDADNSGYKLNTGIIDITDPKTNDNTFILTEGKAFGKEKDSNEKTIRICYGTSEGAEDKKPCDSSDSTGLKEDTNYKLKVEFYGFEQDGTKSKDSIVYFWTFKTGNKANYTSGSTTGDVKSYNVDQGFDCGIFNIQGCVAQVLYSLVTAVSWIPMIAGYFLDFFVYYSTNSSSYTNEFVSQGWGAVRDIANIFFIIALLYVAIKTILGLNVTDNKKIVGAVIIIGLIINFSLFTTKVVIDGSNILAKIFYNNITSVDESGKALPAGSEGQKSISVGLVSKFKPQQLVMATYERGIGYFLFLMILLIIVFLYSAYIFFSVALLFVARVVSLWIAMIFSPLAFVSYAVPFEIPGFGHKEWWKNLLENAFLAPIFTFMLYLIVLFTEFLKTISYKSTTDLSTLENIMQNLMSVLIPFIILMFLLRQAKNIAVKYSGEMGAAIMKGAQMVGGLALGAATGGVAMAARGTVGKLGTKLASSEWAIKRAKAGKMGVMTFGSTLGRASFDARGIKIAGKGLADTGLTNVGKAKEGGFEKKMEDQETKRRQRAADLDKIVERSKSKKDLNKVEGNHQDLLMKNDNAFRIEKIDKRIDAATKAKVAAMDAAKTDPTNKIKKQNAKKAADEVLDLQGERRAIKNAAIFIKSDGAVINESRNTTNGKISGRTKKDAEDAAANAVVAANQAGIEAVAARATAVAATATKNRAIADEAAARTAAINASAAATSAAFASQMNPTDTSLSIAATNAKSTADRVAADLIAAVKVMTDATEAETDAITDVGVKTTAETTARATEATTTATKNSIVAEYNQGHGDSINDLEDTIIPGAKHHLESEKRGVRGGYINQIKERKFANLMFTPEYSGYADDEAIHKIRMETKLDSGAKGH